MFELDETVAFDDNATMIGRIRATKKRGGVGWVGKRVLEIQRPIYG